MTTGFIEIVFNAFDLADTGCSSRDELEDSLNDALIASGLGEVTGGGGGSGVVIIDVEISDVSKFDHTLSLIRQVLHEASAPRSTIIKRGDTKQTFTL
jgi:hypothetical protein